MGADNAYHSYYDEHDYDQRPMYRYRVQVPLRDNRGGICKDAGDAYFQEGAVWRPLEGATHYRQLLRVAKALQVTARIDVETHDGGMWVPDREIDFKHGRLLQAKDW